MKKYLIPLFVLFFFPLFVSSIYAYTEEEVGEHNTENDCWVIYDSGVYDITNYVNDHDRYLDIREWCGINMTEDFETKDSTARDHKSSSYTLLETFYIGDLEQSTTTVTDTSTATTDSTTSVTDSSSETTSTTSENTNKTSNPYNILIPLFLSLVLYWGSYWIYGKSNVAKFNGFWNTVLLLTLLIPSFAFGIFMILRYSFNNLWNIEFDFMYWHVELSIVMSVLGFSHLVQRWKMYTLQLKKK